VPASLVSIVVTEDWTEPDGTDTPTGMVEFNLLENILSPGYCTAKTVRASLANGVIAQQLIANDFDSSGAPLVPSTTQYQVVERILGSPEQMYYVTVPASPPGSRTISDGEVTEGLTTLTSETAAFTDADALAYLLLPGFPVGTQIANVVSATEVNLFSGATASASGLQVLIGASVALSAIRPN
jgi:hypothetical protein